MHSASYLPVCLGSQLALCCTLLYSKDMATSQMLTWPSEEDMDFLAAQICLLIGLSVSEADSNPLYAYREAVASVCSLRIVAPLQGHNVLVHSDRVHKRCSSRAWQVLA